MRIPTLIKVVAAMACLGFAGATGANTLTFQNVTFTTVGAGNQLTLTISNALNATGDWSGAALLGAFEVKGVGGTGVTLMSSSIGTWTESGNELNANGCAGGVSGGYCFTSTPAAALTNSISFVLNFTGTVDFSTPHLKILFEDANGNKLGDLLSRDLVIGSVPEPATLGLLGLGLAGVGFARRRKVGA